MDFEILDRIKTVSDKISLLAEIDICLQSFFKTNESNDQFMKENISYQTYSYMNKVFSDQSIDKKTYLETLRTKLQTLPEVKLTLAYEPPLSGIYEIVDFLSEYLKKQVILDVYIDPKIIAGVVISYQGKYKDLSFKKNLESYLLQRRETIINSL